MRGHSWKAFSRKYSAVSPMWKVSPFGPFSEDSFVRNKTRLTWN